MFDTVRALLEQSPMLALFAVNQAVQLRSDSQRTQTMTTLDRALKRQISLWFCGKKRLGVG